MISLFIHVRSDRCWLCACVSNVRLTSSGRRLGHIHDQMRAGEGDAPRTAVSFRHSRAVDMWACEFFLSSLT